MPTKTDRILSYLPLTFMTSPRPQVLYPVADAFGNELLSGENCLAAILLAHWVDFADKNETRIDDLAKIAALYGLVPWVDESGDTIETVEEFREHLKRYVRTFLQGTVTVQGILRIAAETLGLRIADEPPALDRWWARDRDSVVTVEARGNNAIAQFKFDRLTASGSPALPAHLIGTVNLGAGINLQDANILRLKVNDSVEEIALPQGVLSLAEIVDLINQAPGTAIARRHGDYLKLSAPNTGPASKLEFLNGPNDASQTLLGLLPRTYHGSPATAARYTSPVDLGNPVDLTNHRYLRLEIDGHLAEFDCAGTDAAHTTLNDIHDNINNAFPVNVASHDNKHLTLSSPSTGLTSKIALQVPAAQNAAEKILGVSSFAIGGSDAQPARAEGNRDLRSKIDLSENANIRLRIDGTSRPINCAGVVPDQTERVEIVAAINDAFNAVVAVVTEKNIRLVSTNTGPSAEIVFEQPLSGDATFAIFGIAPLIFKGAGATRAHVSSNASFPNGVDVRANNFLSLAIDGATPVEIDLSAAAQNVAELSSVPLDRIVDHINDSFGDEEIASTDGEKLFLASTMIGGVSQLQILPREYIRERRFVTRAYVIDEAAREVFGFVTKEATGVTATSAKLSGTPDLSHSIDLTTTRFLRLKVDAFPAVEIDCAGPRPRATDLAEILERINSALHTVHVSSDIATTDGQHLILVSPSIGASSQLSLEAPHVALDKLLGLKPGTFRGSDATSVKFTGLVELTEGIDLPAGAAIKLTIDDSPPTEIVLAATAANRSTAEIANAINIAFQSQMATTDGRRITLQSKKQGTDSKIKFEAATNDVTVEVFGIKAPREYHGLAASPARVVGQRDLSGPTDLTVFRFLRLAVDDGATTIDCAQGAAKKEAATLAEIVKSINAGGKTIASASADGKHLVLQSGATGQTSTIELKTFDEGDAGNTLFGSGPRSSSGSDGLRAVITGEKAVVTANLGRRGLLRIAVDGATGVDIDVAGDVPAQTALDEIIERINLVFPNLASATSNNELQLSSPTVGPESKLAVQPLRFLELMEYALQTETSSVTVRHRDAWEVVNNGVTDSYAEITITAPQGAVGPGIVNTAVGWSVHLFVVLERGEKARIFRDSNQALQGEIIGTDGQTRAVPTGRMQTGPLGSQAVVPSKTTWELTGEPNELQLNSPTARNIVLLRSLQPQDSIKVEVVEADISAAQPLTIQEGEHGRLVGIITTDNGNSRLLDGNRIEIASLLPGPDVDLQKYGDAVVKVEGPLYSGTPPLMVVRKIAALFDVTIKSHKRSESFSTVSIGIGMDDEDSLALRINAGSTQETRSELVSAEELDKALSLKLPAGKSSFRYLDCLGSRFDYAHFDHSHFPNGICGERGIFDVSRFSNSPPEHISPIFASSDPFAEPPVKVDFEFEKYGAASFVANLPADLPPRFGGRFNDARFGQDKDSPETFKDAVASPETDPKFLEKLINSGSGTGSQFVKASVVTTVPLGWAAFRMPFRKPQFLTLGEPDRAARLYLREDGLPGRFILLEAKQEGSFGNEIGVTVREVRPAIYDVEIIYRGARFERGRAMVQGATETIQQVLKPGPTGVLQARAAGIRTAVTRDRAEYPSPNHHS